MIVNDKNKLVYLIIGQNIKKYRNFKNYSQEYLAEQVGLTKKTISRYENGEIRIDLDKIITIAEVLGVDSELLCQGSEEFSGVSINNLSTVKLPIIGRVSCGDGMQTIEEIEGYETTPKQWLNGGEYFYTRVQGDSMINARIQDGDLALIRRQPDVEDGEIAAVVIDENIFLKRVFKRDNSVILQSENPKYPPIICDLSKHNCSIIGKLKKLIFNIQ